MGAVLDICAVLGSSENGIQMEDEGTGSTMDDSRLADGDDGRAEHALSGISIHSILFLLLCSWIQFA